MAHHSDRSVSPIAEFFGLEKYQTTIGKELLAGLSTYLSIAYIFVVSPAILSKAGMDPRAALFATAVAACISTFAMGLWANLPFAVAPGLTMSGYFVFAVCLRSHLSWQQGLAAVFMSGCICVIVTWTQLRQWIIESIPFGLKQAIAATVGVFVATIGLYLGKVVAFGSSGWLDYSSLSASKLLGPEAVILLSGFAISLILGLRRLRFPAGMLVALIIGVVLCDYYSIRSGDAQHLSGSFLSSAFKLDFSIIFKPEFWLPVLVFFVLDFFEGVGEFIGLTANTSIQDAKGTVQNLKTGLYVDGLGTILGSLLGTSSLIIFVESAVGIRAGGRTGITALTCGALMMLTVIASCFFAPALTLVPAEAASGVLVYVGYLLLSSSVAPRDVNVPQIFDIAVAAGMSALAFMTFGLDKSLALGFWAYFGRSALASGRQRPAYWLGAIALVLTAEIVWQRLSAVR